MKKVILKIISILHSLEVVTTAYAEPALIHAKCDERYQFLRKGYFTLDKKDTYQTSGF